MTQDKAPKKAERRRAISSSVFDRIFEAGVERGNALDVYEPKLIPPSRVAPQTPTPED